MYVIPHFNSPSMSGRRPPSVYCDENFDGDVIASVPLQNLLFHTAKPRSGHEIYLRQPCLRRRRRAAGHRPGRYSPLQPSMHPIIRRFKIRTCIFVGTDTSRTSHSSLASGVRTRGRGAPGRGGGVGGKKTKKNENGARAAVCAGKKSQI
ncbi:unnamed protein product, partial [Iphiclides podalirius]